MKRALFAPEVVQTSAMDCGPAALTSLLAGHGIDVAYGRLREACQTDVDGTSIDVLEGVANQLGLDAEQVITPVDHVARRDGKTLPAIAVVVQPDGLTHFVVLWRRSGSWVQVMDPAHGRRWLPIDGVLRTLYRHRMTVPADAWHEWARSDEAVAILRAQLGELGVGGALIAEATPDWRRLATLDAACRHVRALVKAKALRRGSEARAALERLLAPGGPPIPEAAFAARPVGDELELTGAVLLSVQAIASPEERAARRQTLGRDLALALDAPPARPMRALAAALAADGWLAPATLGLTVTAAAAMALLEALVFRGLVDAERIFTSRVEAPLGWALAIGLVLALGLLEWANARAAATIGRRLEARFRVAFFDKIPRLGDRYLQSRPLTDMADRGHNLHLLRALPRLGALVLRAGAGLVLTAGGILWLDPLAAPIVVPFTLAFFLLPFVAHPALAEHDLRRRTHTGSLFRLALDALLGLAAIRTHTAEGAIEREHEALLGDWARAGRAANRVTTRVELVGAVLAAGLVTALVATHLMREGASGASLLLVWWGLEVPLHAQQLALGVRQYPTTRNTLLRLLEPLGAPSEGADAAPAPTVTPVTKGAPRLVFEGVEVVAGGHTILTELDLEVAPGEHVAIVGPSGAGKSSLAGLLLGWHRAAAGRVFVDGVDLSTPGRLEALRGRTAWVDPEVQLWNRSLFDNLRYGIEDAPLGPDALSDVMARADLKGVVESLPTGLQTPLGDSGAFLSGGQGQRVRLARAELREDVGLVILDEAMRGLDRAERGRLLGLARDHWASATLLCVTHDVRETASFPRVIVLDGGRVVEDGAPDELLTRDGLYARLMHAEAEARELLWGSDEWRRVAVHDGRVTEDPT